MTPAEPTALMAGARPHAVLDLRKRVACREAYLKWEIDLDPAALDAARSK